MTSHTHYLWFETRKRQEIIDITDQVAEQVQASGVREGFVLVSASTSVPPYSSMIMSQGCGRISSPGWRTPSPRGSRSGISTTRPGRTTPRPISGA